MTAADQPALELSLEPPIARITLNRPQRRNAMNRQMLQQWAEAVTILERSGDCRVVLLTGAGQTFCAGADLDELAQPRAGGPAHLEKFCSDLFERFARLAMVSVAAVQGHALGGGFLATLYCDVRLAQEGARMGFPAAARAWMPPWGLSRLAGWVGAARAEQLVITGRAIPAEEALRIGLVEKIIPQDGWDRVIQDTLAELVAVDPDVVREVRAYFQQTAPVEHAAADRLSSAAFERLLARPEAAAAIGRFIGRDSTSGDS